ncbi:DUF4388 domain-containing protein [Calothrix rhizosoleniae]|uniref:DUF4388 domain-containing protein n=1 Tax=Calothrix rhizosoleniae TaxID=888997 RepID=UPI000B49D19F|nr:DUF4388 domain-containing protein [Calothrix rhizosoleniae]
MAIAGRLAEFSLPEVFQLLEQGNKTGLLTLRTSPEGLLQTVQNYYIWLKEGRIVAAASRLDCQGLLTMLRRRNWIDEHLFKITAICALNKPLGTILKTAGIIRLEQLKMLFYIQVIQKVCCLFEFQDGYFKFDSKASIPLSEMTGLSAPATEVTLAGLRALKKWDALLEKLPDTNSGLISTIKGKPHMHLNQEEWKMWEFVDGKTSVKTISQQLNISMDNIQRIAFRLITVNLCEEIPFAAMKSSHIPENLSVSELEDSQNDLSESFLNNLMEFLKTKI